MSRDEDTGLRLRVNPVKCDAHGLCIEAFPELIARDPWGYPVLPGHTVPRHLLQHARRAVAVCPVLALKLVPAQQKPPR
jgi:ferredoxin